MRVILKKEIEGLGKFGSVVEVKDGFARNYLLPRNLAVRYSKENLKTLEIEKKKLQEIIERKRQDALVLAEKLKNISCTVKVKTGEEDKLFGSVTSTDIVEALRSESIEVDKKDILLEGPIKNLGIYQVPLKLHPEVKTEIRVWVVKE
ncbi:MAG: 50S ribosomal protein L9 [Candidatus Omnitrophica bacterium]|nr:50S ribosomal protein L9 [Candidatus Omnitrophota bacterium]